MEVNCQLLRLMPEQLLTTPPPGQGRSRLTDQKATRAMWWELAQSLIWVQVAGLVSSCWSLRPFMPEMQWPGSPDGHPGNHWSTADKANNTALIAEFRKQLDELGGEHKLLTAFTPADPKNIDAGWDLSKIFDSMDYANVQGYDLHGAGSDNSWEPNRTGHQANLYPDAQSPYASDFSVDGAVQKYLGAGVPPRKLTIGFPFYGRGWKEVAAGGVNGEWQSANGADPGRFRRKRAPAATRTW